jgi:hypothetical protein
MEAVAGGVRVPWTEWLEYLGQGGIWRRAMEAVAGARCISGREMGEGEGSTIEVTIDEQAHVIHTETIYRTQQCVARYRAECG